MKILLQHQSLAGWTVGDIDYVYDPLRFTGCGDGDSGFTNLGDGRGCGFEGSLSGDGDGAGQRIAGCGGSREGDGHGPPADAGEDRLDLWGM